MIVGNTQTPRPVVGVFDSGFGGLTVLRALLQHLPGADFLYLGDTAHLPYGSKSQAAVRRYTSAAVQKLISRGADLVVIACNTASALALPSLAPGATVPLVGVIGPGAQAAARIAAPGSTALVLATEGTVASHAYAEACARVGLIAVEKACPLFVALVEEGWTGEGPGGSVAEQVAMIYLRDALFAAAEISPAAPPSVLLLGCTHYPLLRPLLQRTVQQLAGNMPVVDAAEATARHMAAMLPDAALPAVADPAITFLATDGTAKFQRLGTRFLGREIPHVESVDLDD